MRFQIVDTTGEQALHMVSADPLPPPTFTLFANPDFYFQTFTPACGAPACVDYHYARNHSDVANEIAPAGRTRRQLPSDGRVVTGALGRFGEDMLGSATALASDSTADNSTDTAIEATIADLTAIACVLRGAVWVVGTRAAFGVGA